MRNKNVEFFNVNWKTTWSLTSRKWFIKLHDTDDWLFQQMNMLMRLKEAATSSSPQSYDSDSNSNSHQDDILDSSLESTLWPHSKKICFSGGASHWNCSQYENFLFIPQNKATLFWVPVTQIFKERAKDCISEKRATYDSTALRCLFLIIFFLTTVARSSWFRSLSSTADDKSTLPITVLSLHHYQARQKPSTKLQHPAAEDTSVAQNHLQCIKAACRWRYIISDNRLACCCCCLDIWLSNLVLSAAQVSYVAAGESNQAKVNVKSVLTFGQ